MTVADFKLSTEKCGLHNFQEVIVDLVDNKKTWVQDFCCILDGARDLPSSWGYFSG